MIISTAARWTYPEPVRILTRHFFKIYLILSFKFLYIFLMTHSGLNIVVEILFSEEHEFRSS
jgi:hypothetical protein